jgi:uncharacterized membrane protein
MLNRYTTIGLTVLAGAAVLETALIPGVVIGAAAMLAPRYLRGLRRQLEPLLNSTVLRPAEPMASRPDRQDVEPPPTTFAGLAIGQAIAKTITFRIIVTTLDFTTNYLVIGELATAAGLSTFNLVVGPLFYLAHETAWNYFGRAQASFDLGLGGFTISRPLAKTITFRTIATVMDFTVNYVVVGDVVTAAGPSAFAFVVGPFVYLGHEMAWGYYGSRSKRADLSTPKLLQAPG